jgi:hypothetical protein
MPEGFVLNVAHAGIGAEINANDITRRVRRRPIIT